MENQPIEQSTVQPAEQTAVQESSFKMWYGVMAVVVVMLGLLYFSMQRAADSQVSVEQAQTTETDGGGTTADISAGLDLIQDDSAALDADAESSIGEISDL